MNNWSYVLSRWEDIVAYRSFRNERAGPGSLKTKFLSITKLDKTIEKFGGDEKSVADDVVCRIYIEDMACYTDIVDDYTLKHHDIVGVRVNEKENLGE